ncbi:ATP-binding SpoIIE family protein phosphatase [Streptomyces iconiensis]|uniref:SpoIIE family protein phosphatase n=1 Tax=Streptomyces iconiensis TaxID=1384038 RepID=A0ABT6ZRA6_9ACTN|nr:SpoIIE family protein phosphatase [Streptomyces iconiensis]MDJ1131566.1 SpoIIE family protein phosphatase [Streptomyces iconiensis]
MRTEDVLSALGAGLWTWENATGLVTLDAGAARLLGLEEDAFTASSPTPLTLPGNAVRSHLHAVDYVGFQGIITLALAEQTSAEALLRVVDEAGSVIRTVRNLVCPCPPEDPEAAEPAARIVGMAYEVPEAEAERARQRTERHPRDAEYDESADEAQQWDWRRNREAFLLDTGRALAEAYTTADVLRVASSLAMPGFSPDALAVFCLYGDQLTVYGAAQDAAAAGLGHASGVGTGGARLRLAADDPAAEAVRTGRALYLLSAEEYETRFPTARPVETQPGRNAWAFLPLTVAGRTIGAWMAAFKRQVTFTPDERAVLTTVARMLAQSLSRAMLNESERELSTRLQNTMRPARKPAIPGMELAARYVPTGGGLQIGGDWYDVIPLPSGRTALVIGDVQGHDVRAAGIMGQLRVALRAYASEGHHPDAVLARASRFLYGMSGGDASALPSEPVDGSAGASAVPATVPPAVPAAEPDPYEPGDEGLEPTDPRFATCLYIEVDPATGTLDIARAGHPDPAVQMPDGPMLVRPTAGGLPLGIDPDSDYPTTRLVLEPGQRLLMCTDGLIETGGHDLETGWARIREVVEDHAGPNTDLDQLAEALLRAVHGPVGPPRRRHPGPLADRHEDDIALLLLALGDPGSAEARDGTSVSSRRTVLTIAQAEPDRIAEARHQLKDLLHDWADEDQVDGAVLMLSEMLTNVLVHTDGDALLVAQITGPHEGDEGRTLRVHVSDPSDELPHRRDPGELASSGRGLMLLGMLADRWGVDPKGEGKCIWFEMQEAGPSEKD